MAIGQIDKLQVEGLTADLSALQSEIDAHEALTNNPHSVTATQVGAIPATDKGAANGVAELDANGKVPASQMPAIALERLTVVADQAERFSLTIADVQEGDVVKQVDNGSVYVVTDDTNLDSAAGYTLLITASAAPVDSVFGRVGIVEAEPGDYSASEVANDSGVTGDYVDDALDTLASDLSSHTNNTSNPHGVTATQVGAYTSGEVDALLGDATNIGNGDVNNTELSYLNGVSSNIQTQLNALAPADTLDLVPSGTVNGTNRDFLLRSGGNNVSFASLDPNKVDVYVKRLWQVPGGVDYTIIDNGSGSAMVRFTSGSQPLTGWPIHTRGTVS